ncbi:hypothetical protein AB0J83_43300 [Actinoplanes sp. NPDC049596]|uniref:hypothetical protein n=1 Tax=unclassified Actinoplanes TaxID=2626549 RepID=UPI00343C44E6
MLLDQLAAAGPEERWQALRRIGDSPENRRTLAEIRRNGPGRLRRAALDALAYLGGEAALSPADVRIVERLAGIRRRSDPIGPVTSCWTYWWAMRSTDQDEVVAALGLTHPRPVTYRLAAEAIDTLEHDREAEQGLVYVGPSVDGWVPVMGPWCDAFGDRRQEVRALISDLSRRFGEVHAFYFGERGDGSAWHIARAGVPVRTFDSEEPETSSGEPLPIEREWMAAHNLTGKPEDHPDDLWDITDANNVAATISIDVGWHHPTTAITHGLPLLASAPGAGRILLPPAAYAI